MKHSIIFLQCFIFIASFWLINCGKLPSKVRARYDKCFKLNSFYLDGEPHHVDHICVKFKEKFFDFLSSENYGILIDDMTFTKSQLKITLLEENVITLWNISQGETSDNTNKILTMVCEFESDKEVLKFYGMLYRDVPLNLTQRIMVKIQKLNANDSQPHPTTIAQYSSIHFEDFKVKSKEERAFTITRLRDKNPILIFQGGLFDLSEVKQNNILLSLKECTHIFFILSFISCEIADDFRLTEFDITCHTASDGPLPIPDNILKFMEEFTPYDTNV